MHHVGGQLLQHLGGIVQSQLLHHERDLAVGHGGDDALLLLDLQLGKDRGGGILVQKLEDGGDALGLQLVEELGGINRVQLGQLVAEIGVMAGIQQILQVSELALHFLGTLLGEDLLLLLDIGLDLLDGLLNGLLHGLLGDLLLGIQDLVLVGVLVEFSRLGVDVYRLGLLVGGIRVLSLGVVKSVTRKGGLGGLFRLLSRISFQRMIALGVFQWCGLHGRTMVGFDFVVMSGRGALVLGHTRVKQFVLSAHTIILLTLCKIWYAVGAEAEPRLFIQYSTHGMICQPFFFILGEFLWF